MPVRVFDQSVAVEELGRCELGHQARTKRLVHTAKLLAGEAAGRSLPDRLINRADYEGALNLVNTPAVTQPLILQAHYAGTRQRMLECPGVVLNISDTTELDYTGLKIANLGPIGNGGGRGFECHNSLAVEFATGNVLGLTCQILHVRDSDSQVQAQRLARTGDSVRPARKKGVAGRRPDEPVATCRSRDSRESRLWVKGCEALGELPEGKLWVDVCDRAADTFEFLQFMERNRRLYVIRSKHDRVLDQTPEAVLEVLDDRSGVRLHGWLQSLPSVMSWSVEIAANTTQPARVARVRMSWAAVRLKAPQTHKGEHDDQPVSAWAIRVWEPEPPPGVKEPLEWLLLTNVAIRSNEEARERVSWYEWRSVIEEFHKAQKTGMAIEQLQLQTRGGLEPVIGLLSILAVTLVNWRQLARQPGAEITPAHRVVSKRWVEVLSLRLYREERELSLRQFVLGVARLGGYMNRRRDGWPGWIVLWRGLTKLLHMVDYDLARDGEPPTSPEL